jgi:hypothetical protein
MTLSSNCKNNCLSVITKCVSVPFQKLQARLVWNCAVSNIFLTGGRELPGHRQELFFLKISKNSIPWYVYSTEA